MFDTSFYRGVYYVAYVSKYILSKQVRKEFMMAEQWGKPHPNG